METLVVVNGGKIKATVGNWDKSDRSHLQADEQAKMLAEYGAGTTLEVVTDPDQAAVDARGLEPEWDWNAGKGIGVEPVDMKAEREALEALLAEEEAAKADLAAVLDNVKAIAAGTYGGTATQANRVLARAVLSLVLKESRATEEPTLGLEP